MVEKLLISLVFAIIGFIIATFKLKGGTIVVNIINKSLFYIIIPIIIFNSIYGSEELYIFISTILTSAIHIFLVFVTAYIMYLVIGIKETKSILAFSISVAMPNAAYLAIPLSTIFFGDSKSVIPYTIAFNIILPIIIITLCCIYSKWSNERNLVIAKSIPFILALLLAFILRNLDIDITGLYTLANIASLYTITSFILIGYELANSISKNIKQFTITLLLAIAIRFIISPIIMIALVNFLNVSNYLNGLMLQSIMPPAVTNIVIAKMFKLDTDIVSILISVMTPASIVILFVTDFFISI